MYWAEPVYLVVFLLLWGTSSILRTVWAEPVKKNTLYLAMPIPPHVVWRTMPQMVKCFSQVLTFAQILAYSQFHKFLPLITNHRGWWMVRGVIGASSCPTKPSTAVNQLQPKSCRKPPKRTTPYHVVHIISTGTTCVIPWQPGANHGNLVTAIIPALL